MDTAGRMFCYVQCLLLDFSRAFDTVDHLLLLKKIHNYHLQVPGNILSWIVSFSLTDLSALKLSTSEYLLSQLRKPGVSDKCIGIVYDAIVLSKVL